MKWDTRATDRVEAFAAYGTTLPPRCWAIGESTTGEAVSCACPAEKSAPWEKTVLKAAEDHTTILVVEDEVLVRIVVTEELRAQGFAVIEATNASEAISVLQSSMRIDLVLTDIRMPGDLDGLGLARMMRKEHPLVKVVIASGRKPDTEEHEIVDGFFFKPYDMPKLVSHIKSLLI